MLDKQNQTIVYLRNPIRRWSPLSLATRTASLVILFNSNFFKNRPRTLFLILRALGIVTVTAVFLFGLWLGFFSEAESDVAKPAGREKIFLAVFVAYLTATLGVYWNLMRQLRYRWAKAATFYQELLATAEGEKTKHHARPLLKDYLESEFALQILNDELWAHRTFAGFFQANLCKAVQNIPEDRERALLFVKLHAGDITETRARKLLERWQRQLKEEMLGKTATSGKQTAAKNYRRAA